MKFNLLKTALIGASLMLATATQAADIRVLSSGAANAEVARKAMPSAITPAPTIRSAGSQR